MRKYLLMIIVFCFSNLKGEEGLISLQDFARDISNNRTFTFPQRRELTTPAYSIISLDEGIYTSVFPIDLPEGTLVPDFAAEVKIDAGTGKVLQVLGG